MDGDAAFYTDFAASGSHGRVGAGYTCAGKAGIVRSGSIDGGMDLSEAPENLVLELLRKIRAEIAEVREDLDLKTGSLRMELSGRIDSLRADVASDFVLTNARIDAARKETGEQIVGLRRAVVEYHSAVVGHGMLISELDERMRRVENHLGLPAMEPR